MYQINIHRNDCTEVNFIKCIRTAGAISLAEAKRCWIYLQMHGKVTLVAGLKKDSADKLASNLNAEGIQSDVVVSSVLSPMQFKAGADEVFAWGSPRTLRRLK
jgi:ribosomal protein L7/L12